MAKRGGSAFAAMQEDPADAFVNDAPGGVPGGKEEEARVSVRIDAKLHHALKVHLTTKGVSMKDWLVGAIERELGR